MQNLSSMTNLNGNDTIGSGVANVKRAYRRFKLATVLDMFLRDGAGAPWANVRDADSASYDSAKFQSLLANVETNGILQPPVIGHAPDGGIYGLCGFRRAEALRRLVAKGIYRPSDEIGVMLYGTEETPLTLEQAKNIISDHSTAEGLTAGEAFVAFSRQLDAYIGTHLGAPRINLTDKATIMLAATVVPAILTVKARPLPPLPAPSEPGPDETDYVERINAMYNVAGINPFDAFAKASNVHLQSVAEFDKAIKAWEDETHKRNISQIRSWLRAYYLGVICPDFAVAWKALEDEKPTRFTKKDFSDLWPQVQKYCATVTKAKFLHATGHEWDKQSANSAFAHTAQQISETPTPLDPSHPISVFLASSAFLNRTEATGKADRGGESVKVDRLRKKDILFSAFGVCKSNSLKALGDWIFCRREPGELILALDAFLANAESSGAFVPPDAPLSTSPATSEE